MPREAGLSARRWSPEVSLALRQGWDSAPSLLASKRQLWSPGGPHPAALLHTRGACVSSSGIYGALTVCLTVLDVGEGANDTHNLSATYGLTGRVQTSWGQGGALESPTGPRSRTSRKASEVPGPPGCLNPRLEARVLGLQTNCRSWVIQMGWRLHVLTLRGRNHFRSRVWSGRAFWRRRSSSLRGCVLGDGAGLLQSRAKPQSGVPRGRPGGGRCSRRSLGCRPPGTSLYLGDECGLRVHCAGTVSHSGHPAASGQLGRGTSVVHKAVRRRSYGRGRGRPGAG